MDGIWMSAEGALLEAFGNLPLGDRFRSSPSPSEASPYFSNHKSGRIRRTEGVVMPAYRIKMAVPLPTKEQQGTINFNWLL